MAPTVSEKIRSISTHRESETGASRNETEGQNSRATTKMGALRAVEREREHGSRVRLRVYIHRPPRRQAQSRPNRFFYVRSGGGGGWVVVASNPALIPLELCLRSAHHHSIFDPRIRDRYVTKRGEGSIFDAESISMALQPTDLYLARSPNTRIACTCRMKNHFADKIKLLSHVANETCRCLAERHESAIPLSAVSGYCTVFSSFRST